MPQRYNDKPFWEEIRSDFISERMTSDEGDKLAEICIDAWTHNKEEGTVIAKVMLSTHGDILVAYIDPVARIDAMAQESIAEAKEHLSEYYKEQTQQKEDPSKEFTVDTPHGTLRIYDKEDPEYPGVWIGILQPDNQEITLAMVEYIPGGEGLSDNWPKNRSEMRRQENEVPQSRRNGNAVSAGFVTRSWPSEAQDMDTCYRTFHTGYELPRHPSLDQQISSAKKQASSQISQHEAQQKGEQER